MSMGTSVTTAEQAGDGTQQKAQEVAAQAQEKAQEAATQVKGKLREQLDQRSSEAAQQITEQASDLRSVSASLREQGKEQPAKAADRLAEYGEKVGGYLQDKDSDALLADAEDFARRQPWAVGAAALALGFAAARFLKASSRERYSAQRAYSPTGAPQLTQQSPAVGPPSYSGPPVGV